MGGVDRYVRKRFRFRRAKDSQEFFHIRDEAS